VLLRNVHIRKHHDSIIWAKAMIERANGLALPALGRAAGRRPTGKMLRHRKRLGIAPESPASGATYQPRCAWLLFHKELADNELFLSTLCWAVFFRAGFYGWFKSHIITAPGLSVPPPAANFVPLGLNSKTCTLKLLTNWRIIFLVSELYKVT
jgi:hypothetical protein